MVQRPVGTNAFEFVIVSSLRAAQLMRGCTPRVASTHKTIMTAQLEVAAGKVGRLIPPPPGVQTEIGSKGSVSVVEGKGHKGAVDLDVAAAFDESEVPALVP